VEVGTPWLEDLVLDVPALAVVVCVVPVPPGGALDTDTVLVEDPHDASDKPTSAVRASENARMMAIALMVFAATQRTPHPRRGWRAVGRCGARGQRAVPERLGAEGRG
jgi:hypothetical protein